MRALDQGGICCCRSKKTSKTTIQSYVNLYSGPPHSMNYKYSLVASTVWITFMYGLALPLLFPIAAFTFFNLILMERILITYYHSKPPMYDDKLNTQTLNLMKWSPMLLMIFGYWFLGQPQMFDNFAATRVLTTDVEITG